MIELRSVNRVYGSSESAVHALADVSLDVRPGQFVRVMGRSGSGKSTLLNLISAIDQPSSGSIRIAGQDVARLEHDELTKFRRRNIGLVFQFFNLLPTLTALENALVPVMLDRAPAAADRERAMQLLHDVGIAKRSNHHIHQLSGGEIQRVAIARALIMQPGLLLADEPTGNLDSETSAAILGLLKTVCERNKTTVVMVTHDVAASGIGDRVLWLNAGRLQRDEPVRPLAPLLRREELS